MTTETVSRGTVRAHRSVAPWLTLSSSQQGLPKWLAVFTMTLDHANRTLWPFQGWAFAVGRLAFPLFVFLLAYNLTVRHVPARRYRTVYAVAAEPAEELLRAVSDEEESDHEA